MKQLGDNNFTNKIQYPLDNIYKIITMQNTITIQIDEDNDIFELTVDNETYDLYNVYDSNMVTSLMS